MLKPREAGCDARATQLLHGLSATLMDPSNAVCSGLSADCLSMQGMNGLSAG